MKLRTQVRKPRNTIDEDSYRSTDYHTLVRLYDKLKEFVSAGGHTLPVLALARQERDYLRDVIAFRDLGKKKRLELAHNGISPWFGNWTAGEAS